jgi:hypothetical protein
VIRDFISALCILAAAATGTAAVLLMRASKALAKGASL